MTKTENQIRNCINYNDELNECPKCGSPAYELETSDGMHHVGCIHCGLKLSSDIIADPEVAEGIKARARIAWNEHCLNSFYTEEALDVLDIEHGNYVLVDSCSSRLVCAVPNITAAKDYILDHKERAFSIFLHLNGTLQVPGHSWIMQDLFIQPNP